MRTARLPEAEGLFQKALALNNRFRGEESIAALWSIQELGMFYFVEQNSEKSKEFVQKALTLIRKAHPPDSSDLAGELGNFGVALGSVNDFNNAEQLLNEALAIDEKTLGKESSGVATWELDLANLFYVQGNGVEAEQLFRKSLSIDEKTIGLKNPGDANALNTLAGLLRERQQYADADPLCRRGIKIGSEVFGDQSPV